MTGARQHATEALGHAVTAVVKIIQPYTVQE